MRSSSFHPLSCGTTNRPARKHYRWWHNGAVSSRLVPIAEKARMIRRRFDNIVT
jgi:hypothetical protein